LSDGLAIVLLIFVIALPLIVIGYVIALHTAGAVMVHGLPHLSETGVGSAAPWSDLLVSLFQPGAVDRALELLGKFQQLRDQSAFLVLFGTGTLIVLAAVLTALLATVAATVLHGGPIWHRRFGLEVVVARDGSFPSWSRASGRWLLAVLFSPCAPFFILAGRRGPHDLLSGCDVRRRPT
jgi:hypothetical protein